MKKLVWLLLLISVFSSSAYAATSSDLIEKRTETATGYTLTYFNDDIPTFATDKGYASIERVVENGHTVKELYYDEYGKPVAVSGYDVRNNVYDGEKLIRIEYYKAGHLVKNSSGYAIIERSVDDKGHAVLELYYNEKGDPVKLSGGQYGMRRDLFDENDRVTKYTYIGMDCNPITLSSGYSAVERTYDEAGRSEVEMFFTPTGDPAVLSLGHNGIQYLRDENGKHIGSIYLDADGEPMTNNQGYGIIRYEYDEWNNIVKQTYYDWAGTPVALSRGQYGQGIEYHQKQKIRSYYIDADGNEMFFMDQYLAANPVVVYIAVFTLVALAVCLPQRGCQILLGGYIIFILYMTLFVRESGDQKLNFELFWSYKQIFNDPILGREVINNILLFIPLGALLYSINPKLFIITPLLSIAVEAIQYIGGFGLCELDDVFGNTLGGVIGWGVMWLLSRKWELKHES